MTVTDTLVCWRCGASLDDLPLPLGRSAECKGCGAQLHVCRLCEFYDPRVAKACREPIAEEVMDKERANFCDYFHPRPDAYVPCDGSVMTTARAELDALFGDVSPPLTGVAGTREALERLFGGPDKVGADKKQD